jgi:hypothetical protein
MPGEGTSEIYGINNARQKTAQTRLWPVTPKTLWIPANFQLTISFSQNKSNLTKSK